jgi:hypothetical protein
MLDFDGMKLDATILIVCKLLDDQLEKTLNFGSKLETGLWFQLLCMSRFIAVMPGRCLHECDT